MSKDLEKVVEIAKGAGAILLDFYDRDYSTQEKDNNTPVTEADFAAEKYIKEELNKSFSYPILSEETVDNMDRLKSEYLWIVDPMDGTKDFISKSGEFTVVVGLARKSESILGVVYNPFSKQLFFAEKGGGAFFQERDGEIKPAHVSGTIDFSKATFLVSRSGLTSTRTVEILEELGVKDSVPVGSFAYKVGLIAIGKFDTYFSFGSLASEWDTCAPDIIIREAGGEMTDLYGDPLLYNQENVKREKGMVITNGALHQDLLSSLKPYIKA